VLEVHADGISEERYDEVVFGYGDLPSPWCVVRALRDPSARVETWRRGGCGDLVRWPESGPFSDDVLAVLALVEGLSDDYVLDLCMTHQVKRCAWAQERYDEAYYEAEDGRAGSATQAELEMTSSATRESVLCMEPGPLKTVAIEIGRSWCGEFDDLLFAAEAVMLRLSK